MLWSRKENNTSVYGFKKTTEILGVFSPLGRCLKTSFTLTLGQILAKDKAILYLNMEEYSDIELLGKEFAHNLSDLLYYVRQDNQNLLHKMNSMVQTIGNLDYTPPVQMPADIKNSFLVYVTNPHSCAIIN